MREASEDDFFIPLEGVGQFRYGRRTFGDRLIIRRDYLRWVQEFGDEDEDLSLYATMIATHDCLCVECPPGWENLALLDTTKPDQTIDHVLALALALKNMEDSFRKGVEKSGQGEGAGSAELNRVSLSPDLQPASEGSPGVGADGRGDVG